MEAVTDRVADDISSTAGSTLSADVVVHEALAREMLAACLQALRSHNMDAASLQRAWQSALCEQQEGGACAALMREVVGLGQLTDEWSSNPEYLDVNGRPRALRIDGRSSSFAALAWRHLPHLTVDEVMRRALEVGVIEAVDSQHVAFVSDCMLFNRNATLRLAHLVSALRGLLGSATHNAAAESAALVPERQAWAVLPEEDFPDFVAAMRLAVCNLVDMSARWLNARVTARAGRAPVGEMITMGLEAFVFRE